MKTHLLFTKKILLLALVVSVVSTGVRPQTARSLTQGPTQAASLTQSMPVDPQITIGTFKNGLRYYIRANKKPEKRAELRLVIKAGSILEDDDQRGLAHLVEHGNLDDSRFLQETRRGADKRRGQVVSQHSVVRESDSLPREEVTSSML